MMNINMKSSLILILALVISSSVMSQNNKPGMRSKTIMELTTFNIESDANPTNFAKRDTQVEEDFTSKQPGFIKRQSAIDDKGNYVVIVFWESLVDANASMNKFMNDASVSDYAKMINSSTMQMSRYVMDKTFNAVESRFVELMSFDLKPGTDIINFNALNQKVETDFTGKRQGFLQRLTGVNELGKQVVAVYWSSKSASDAALHPFMEAPISKEFMQKINQASVNMGRYKFLNMELNNKEKVVALLNSFNTGDKSAISYINPNKYIQHNLSVADGLKGFGEVLEHAPPQGFKAKVVRAFQDGEFVFTHTEYDFFGPKIGFDVFRFEDGLIVEHWDNLIEVQPVNPSGRTQTDGAADITNKEKTEANREVVKGFLDDVLYNHESDKMTTYINPTKYIQHNPAVADGLDGFGAAMKYFAENGLVMEYTKTHKILAEGNFVLSMSEGKFGKGDHTAFYDLFRLENGQIVEHWDVIAPIPPESDWKNDNGKF